MNTRYARSTVVLLAGLSIVLIAGCGSSETVAEGTPRKIKTLPEDEHKGQSRKKAGEFRTWAGEKASKDGMVAVRQATRIIGEWDKNTGAAYIATTIEKGDMKSALLVAQEFDAWQNSKQGIVSVYDDSGELLIANRKF